MNKEFNKQKERLADLQGVLLRLVEESQNESEREFYEILIDKIENKIKEI